MSKLNGPCLWLHIRVRLYDIEQGSLLLQEKR